MSPALLAPASQMDLRWKSPDVERGGGLALHTLTRKQRKSIERKPTLVQISGKRGRGREAAMTGMKKTEPKKGLVPDFPGLVPVRLSSWSPDHPGLLFNLPNKVGFPTITLFGQRGWEQ